MDVANLRKEYVRHGLLEHEVQDDPIAQFRIWLSEATRAGIEDPNAMTLATASRDGRPNARIVLLKGVDESGFSFFTNYTSPKANELDENPRAALVFYWHDLERQVRVEGDVARTTAAEADAYFQKRPRESQFGALASPQSQPVASRAELEARLTKVRATWGETGDVERPAHWGGFRVWPLRIEFWQGRPARLHDRLLFERGASGWSRSRLAP